MDTTVRNYKVTVAQRTFLRAIWTNRYARGRTSDRTITRLEQLGCVIHSKETGSVGHVLTQRGSLAMETGVIDYSLPATRRAYALGRKDPQSPRHQPDLPPGPNGEMHHLETVKQGDIFTDTPNAMAVDEGYILVHHPKSGARPEVRMYLAPARGYNPWRIEELTAILRYVEGRAGVVPGGAVTFAEQVRLYMPNTGSDARGGPWPRLFHNVVTMIAQHERHLDARALLNVRIEELLDVIQSKDAEIEALKAQVDEGLW